MAVRPNAQQEDDVPQTVPALRDEVAEHRQRRNPAPLQRQPQAAPRLTEPDREQYELQLDAFEVRLADAQHQLRAFASQLEAAHRDGLTGAWARHAGGQLLEEELERASRSGVPLSIAFVDVDGLKRRNDRLGHAAGDEALVAVATTMICGLRSYDHVVRWGGDEFLCILPELGYDEAVRRMEQARHALAGGTNPVSVSVGIAERRPDESPAALVHRADEALYRSRGLRLLD